MSADAAIRPLVRSQHQHRHFATFKQFFLRSKRHDAADIPLREILISQGAPGYQSEQQNDGYQNLIENLFRLGLFLLSLLLFRPARVLYPVGILAQNLFSSRSLLPALLFFMMFVYSTHINLLVIIQYSINLTENDIIVNFMTV